MKTRWWIAGLTLLLLALLAQSQYYLLRPRTGISPIVLAELKRQAELALAGREVPIGAVVLYGDSIVGAGHNTVVRDTNLSAHAEINALVDAHRRLLSHWKEIDRSKLVVYSTYEPCAMCKGAMMNLGVRSAVFEGRNAARDQLNRTWQSWWYECSKRRFFAPGMQDSLFWRHPDFPGKVK